MTPYSGTHIAYYHICHRKLWLFHHAIRMEHTSDVVAEGRLIHETSYPDRARRYTELSLGPVKIDYYDPKERLVHEVKKTAQMEDAHFAQVKYYLWYLAQNGMEGATALLEYPKLKQTESIALDEATAEAIPHWLSDIERIVSGSAPPSRLSKKTFCKKCSYFDFCWSE
jgi:CRISPR-associated exonuclease Cas4